MKSIHVGWDVYTFPDFIYMSLASCRKAPVFYTRHIGVQWMAKALLKLPLTDMAALETRAVLKRAARPSVAS